jgi:hypothetical protein
VAVQVNYLGRAYIEDVQWRRLQSVLNGTAGDPWQYRALSSWLVELLRGTLAWVGAPAPWLSACIAMRLAQNAAIFGVAYAFYRRLGANSHAAMVGLALAAWAMTHALFESDLQFNTYSDVLIYLLAGWCILAGRYKWIVPLAAIGALNRETSALVPVLLAAEAVMLWRRRKVQTTSWQRAGGLSLAAMAAWVLGQAALRLSMGPQTMLTAYVYEPGTHPLVQNVLINLSRRVTWLQLGATFSVVPLVALALWRRWPSRLRMFFAVIVPAWLAIHVAGSVLAETRLLLVPMLVVFVPGAIAGLAPRGDAPGDVRQPAIKSTRQVD